MILVALLGRPTEETQLVRVADRSACSSLSARNMRRCQNQTHSPCTLSTHVPSNFFHSASGPYCELILLSVSSFLRISLLR